MRLLGWALAPFVLLVAVPIALGALMFETARNGQTVENRQLGA